MGSLIKMGGSLVAMDAEQKRDADGKFGSGGSSGGGKTDNSRLKDKGYSSKQIKEITAREAAEASEKARLKGKGYSPAQIKQIMSRSDAENSGKISKANFKRIVGKDEAPNPVTDAEDHQALQAKYEDEAIQLGLKGKHAEAAAAKEKAAFHRKKAAAPKPVKDSNNGRWRP